MFRTPSCFLLIGGIIAALSLLGLLLVTEPEQDKEKQQEQREEELPSLNAREVLQTSLFYQVRLDITIFSFLLFLFADMDSILLNLCHHGNICIIKVRNQLKIKSSFAEPFSDLAENVWIEACGF